MDRLADHFLRPKLRVVDGLGNPQMLHLRVGKGLIDCVDRPLSSGEGLPDQPINRRDRMALFDDVLSGGNWMTGLAIGIGAVVVLPLAGPILRPLAKTAIKSGIQAYRGTAGGVGDLVAEAVAEIGPEVAEEAVEAAAESAE